MAHVYKDISIDYAMPLMMDVWRMVTENCSGRLWNVAYDV